MGASHLTVRYTTTTIRPRKPYHPPSARAAQLTHTSKTVNGGKFRRISIAPFNRKLARQIRTLSSRSLIRGAL